MAVIIIIFALAVGISLLGLLLKILKGPIKLVWKLFLHAIMGFVFLFIFNFLAAFVDLSIPITWLNAVITGVLGIPGVILLLILQLI
ncbi:MAG: pro-sigmaK processing inhibitor BofA family protein [Oscillospiraceae bacterium]|nr:pro-sigmaK processing inhibitor BofA family protein [Oscillospiraceae bacterium]